jgi:serine phosphatase RsbU (regulator of sigma subunit)
MADSQSKAYGLHDVPEGYLRKWQETINVLARTFGVPAGLIMRVLPKEIEVLVSSQNEDNPYEPGQRAKLDMGLYCETVMATESPLHVPNALKDPDWENSPDIKLNMTSYLGMPLIWPDGSVFGTVCVLDKKQVQGGDNYIQLLKQFKQIIEGDFELFERNARLKEALRNLEEAHTSVRDANRRMSRDLDAAREIQQALLPKRALCTDRLDVAWLYRPCDELGGDMLNVFPLANQQVGFFVLDVSGHGVPAALLAVTAARALWPFAGHDIEVAEDALAAFAPNLDTRVAEFNRTFAMEATAGRLLTLLYGAVDLRDRVLRFVCAGHPFPLLSRGGEVREIGVPGLPIGVIREAEYEVTELELQRGDRIYVYSDGFLEEPNSSKQLFGSNRLQESILQTHEMTLDESVDTLLNEVLAWGGRDQLRDDASIIALEIG